jgi:SAM-dependent methyltransferase
MEAVQKRSRSGILPRLRAWLAVPPEPFLITRRSRDRVNALVAAVGPEGVVLNIGAGYTNFGRRVINVDLFNSGTTDVIASATACPFREGSADLVILQGLLEHVDDARATIGECCRMLKPGGLLYAEMPFLQPYHECPIDLRRTTLTGFARLCAPLVEVDSGIHIGPASTLAWMLREFFAALVSGGRQPLYRRSFSIAGWLVFPLKYADYFLERQPSLHTVASSCYYLGQRR